MTINNLVNTQTSQQPNKVAIRHGKNGVTYTQLNNTSSQLVRYLAKKNIIENDVIALAGDRSAELIIFLLACAKAGVTYLPIDNNLPIDRINYMLDDAAVKMLITSRRHAEKYASHQNIIFIEDALEEAKGYDDTDLDLTPDPEGIAYILYTSGSTGRPKGVLVKRAGLFNLLQSITKSPGITAADTMLFTTTISFDIAELEIFLPIVNGATVLIADAETVKDGRALVDMARREQVTIMQGTPFMWRTMLEAGWEEKLPIKVFCGGEAMTKQLAHDLLQRSNEVWNMYGPTETTVYSIIKKIGAVDKVITVGKPLRNTQVYLLDEDLNQVPNGEVGEIYIGGDGVAQGYLNRPDLTDERFIADKFSGIAGQKIYKTGDLGQLLTNGDVLCLGRVDHQIKIRGYRIEAEEVETQLKDLTEINNVLVVPYTDEAGNVHLVAYVVTNNPFPEEETPARIQTWK
ncbi:amino acid adenylation domain-containing protein, partial [Mucilaginibacter sp.]|uniref:amino acid adenylation domain-containing protein n=1 Tax=Mucilaginibacter sp. TaxID=1882438 RepID=UPI0035BBB1E6